MSNKDKPWLTPLIKAMIDDRWTAYREKDWARYNHLKCKVRSEIMKASFGAKESLTNEATFGTLYAIFKENPETPMPLI